MSADRDPRQLARHAMEAALRREQVKRAGVAALLTIARRLNYHVLRGMADSTVRPDADRFAEASPWKLTLDYVRDGALELITREIDQLGVPGSLAELGVFRGDFAWLMATLLPGRRIHLFDTFAGFDDQEVEQDRDVVDTFMDFSETDASAVRSRFADPGLVELHVGRFPATTEGVEDTFALVSLDADLYAPILSGLRWFYPRLSPGGAILIHDFNNSAYGGTKQAVREFQREVGVPVVPLPDWAGSAVVVKPGRLGTTG